MTEQRSIPPLSWKGKTPAALLPGTSEAEINFLRQERLIDGSSPGRRFYCQISGVGQLKALSGPENAEWPDKHCFPLP